MIRNANKEDAKRLLEIYSYYVLNTAITFEYDVPSPDEFQKRIMETSENYPYLVLEEDGEIKGYAYAGPFVGREAYKHSCELSVYVDHRYLKQGYGKKLYDKLIEALSEKGILNLYACIGDPIVEDEYLTKNSEQFHQHMGFNKVGEFHKCGYKFDRWYNMIWMEKIIGEHDWYFYQRRIIRK